MQYLKGLVRASAVLAAVMAGPAMGAGTDAGVVVTNTVTLGFEVNGAAQADVSASVDFTVDRKYDVDVVQNNGDDYVAITAGSTYTGNVGVPALVFDVSNTSNDSADVLVGVYNQSGTLVSDFASSPGGSTFAGSNLIVAQDTNANGVYDDSTDTVLTPTGGVYSLGTLTEDQLVTLLVVVDIPGAGTVAADDYASYTLVAAIGASGTGTALAADDSGNEAPWNAGGGSVNANTVGGVESVFVDDGGATADDEMFDFTTGTAIAGQDTGFDTPSSGDRPNGQHSDTSGFVVVQPALLVGKYVEVLYDPISGQRYDADGDAAPGANEPKAIPGAVMMYVAGGRNNELAGTGYTASNVTFVTDLADGPEVADEGVPAGYPAINLPSVVTFDVADDPTTPTVTVAVTVDPSAFVTDTGTVTALACDGTTVTTPGYAAGTVVQGVDAQANEVDVNIGTCAPTEEGFVVYFVTVQ